MPQNNWKTTDTTDIKNAQLVPMLCFLGGQYGDGSLLSESCVEICNMYLLGGVYLEHLASQASASWFDLFTNLNFPKKNFPRGLPPTHPFAGPDNGAHLAIPRFRGNFFYVFGTRNNNFRAWLR